MKVKLNSKWQTYDANSVIEVEDTIAKSLILAEKAVEYDEKAEKAEQDREAKTKALVQDAVAGALKNVKTPAFNLHLQVDEKPAKVYKSLGDQLMDVKTAGSGTGVARLNDYVSKAPAGASEIVDADGGYLVQEDFMSELFEIISSTSVLAPKAKSTSVNGNGLFWNEVDKYNRTDGNRAVSVYRTTEAGTKQASKPTFARRSLQLMKLAGLYYATDELLEDATALESEIRGWFAEEFSFVVDNEMVRGTGVGQMLGILNSPALVTVTKAGARTATTLVNDVTNMFARMYPAGITGAEWFIANELLPYIMRLQIANQPVWLPPNGLIGAPAGTLLGRPINVIEQCSAIGAVGDIIFADWSQYKIITKAQGIKADVSIHVKFVTDETAFRFVVRNNGTPLWSNYITPANGAATLSPFIVLGS